MKEEMLKTILSAAAIVGMLAFGARWVADRIAKIVDAKAEARYQLEHLKLQTLESRVESRLGVATSFEHAAHVAMLPKRIEAVERLWKSTLALASRMPRGLHTLDVVTEDEYPESREQFDDQFPKPPSLNEALDHVSLLYGTESVDELRPFVSEELWHIFSAHRAFFGRVLFLTINPQTKLKPWYKDQPALELLRAAVPAGLTLVGIGSWYSARVALDGALLAEIKRLLDGAGASARSVETMRAIEGAIRKADSPAGAAVGATAATRT